jgi:hypothetical protein
MWRKINNNATYCLGNHVHNVEFPRLLVYNGNIRFWLVKPSIFKRTTTDSPWAIPPPPHARAPKHSVVHCPEQMLRFPVHCPVGDAAFELEILEIQNSAEIKNLRCVCRCTTTNRNSTNTMLMAEQKMRFSLNCLWSSDVEFQDIRTQVKIVDSDAPIFSLLARQSLNHW